MKTFKKLSVVLVIVMFSDEDLAGLGVKDGDTLQRVAAAAKEAVDDPSAKTKALASKYNVPLRNLQRYFKKLGITRGDEKGVSAAQKELRKMETAALTTEAEKIATIAIGIGGVIARRYLPLINHLLANGRTLDMIATDVMDWYEMKAPTEARISELEANIVTFRGQASEAWAIAAPNFRYMLKAKLTTDFAKRILMARISGVRVPVRSSLRAFHNELDEVDKDFERLMEKKENG